MGGTLTHPLQTSVKSEKYLLANGLKSLSTPSSTDLPGGSLMQPSKVQNRFIVPKLHSRTLPHLDRAVFISDQSRTESSSMFPIGVRVVNGNIINNYTKFPSLNTPQAPQPLPLSCHSVKYFILVQVPLRHPAVLRSWFHLPLPFFGPDVFPPLN